MDAGPDGMRGLRGMRGPGRDDAHPPATAGDGARAGPAQPAMGT